MFWADKIAKTIIDSGIYKPYWVDDMKTPSGRIHVGSLRGVVIHDLVYQALLHAGKKTKFTYVFEDHDPMDALPNYLDANIWGKYLGQPLFTIPSPDGKSKSYAHYFALEFKEVFNKIGSHPEILWTSDLYTSGKMNSGIKLCLDNVETIRDIYEETYKKKLQKNWYPFQVVCPQCGKESTTRVTSWDGNEVTFICQVDKIEWTRGCGLEGKASPFSDKGKFVGKLSWKVEWPLKWKVIDVTVEGAGKDHMSAGGSHDIAKQVCERVLKYPVPFPVAYEFFLIGGKKMSSSKGLGTSSKEISDVLPPYLLRFLFTRTDFSQAIDFDPVGNMYIPDLFDEYDRFWREYNTNGDSDLVRVFEMSQIESPPKKNPSLYLPRFRSVATYLQMANVDLVEKFSAAKGSALTSQEKGILNERVSYAKIWVDRYAPAEFKYHMTEKLPTETSTLTGEQRDYLKGVFKLMEVPISPEELQKRLYELAKNQRLNVQAAFAAIYRAFLGKPHGPQAAWFLLQYPKEEVVKRLLDASVTGDVSKKASENPDFIFRPDLFTIDHLVKEKYPSISIGVAVIRNVRIEKTDPVLEKEKTELIRSLAGVTTESINSSPEVKSYRKLYKEMGVDWHSRRPSPEALLRRVALGKGLYIVNTCVDAYNLVVMKHGVSVGAFDADQVNFPTVLRYAGEGDEILLLGDSEPTKYREKELAYYDQLGGYNIDFNYRDAQRTKVSEETKNIWINVDGVYDITPDLIEKTLKESVEKIIIYCGGTLDIFGVVE